MTPSERMAHIDRQFDISMGVFDGRMRDEQAAIAGQRGARGGSGSGAGAAAEDGSGGNGNDSGAAGSKDGGQGQGQGQAGQGQAGQGQGQAGAGNASGQGGNRTGGGGGYGGGAKGGSGPNTVPADIPDGSDDDVVARQLREAATAETDPELREKLWNEYRQYKKGN